MTELKPCPFCGGNAFLYYKPKKSACSSVLCNGIGCDAEMGMFEDCSTDEVIARWNTRAGDKRISPPKEVSPVRDEAFYNDIMERDAGIIKEQAAIINKLNQKINQLRQKLKTGDKDDSA